jgi:hypothetical protein
MFVAFMPLHILLCDEVLPGFVLHVEVVHSSNLNLNQIVWIDKRFQKWKA